MKKKNFCANQKKNVLTFYLIRPVLKGIDGRAPPGVEPVAQFDSTRENLPGPDIVRIDRLRALS